MSQGNDLPLDLGQASAQLLQKIYVPTFMAKLAADYGIQPQSEEDTQNLLQIAAVLAQGLQEQRVGQSPTSRFLDEAVADLTGVHKTASDITALDDAEQQVIRDQLQNDPDLLQAALVYGYATAR